MLFTIEILTGYFSSVAYAPALGDNSITGVGPHEAPFDWRWPTEPAWLYGLNWSLPVLAGPAWRLWRVHRDKRRRVPVVHHLVGPAALSVLLLLAWLPLILRLPEGNYRPTSGVTQEPYLERWLAVTAACVPVDGVNADPVGRGAAKKPP